MVTLLILGQIILGHSIFLVCKKNTFISLKGRQMYVDCWIVRIPQVFRRRSRFTQSVWSVGRDLLFLLFVPKETPEIQTIIFLIYDGNGQQTQFYQPNHIEIPISNNLSKCHQAIFMFEQCWYGVPVYCPLLVLVGNISLNTHYRLSFNP